MIIRLAKQNRGSWTVISNDLLQDTSLSLEALGLLCYLLSKPDDWEVRVSEIQQTWGLGRARLQRIMQELADAGYARLQSKRNGNGQMSGKEWIIFEEKHRECMVSPDIIADPPTAQFSDRRENRPSGKPTVGKLSCIQNTEVLQKTELVQKNENNINRGSKRTAKNQPPTQSALECRVEDVLIHLNANRQKSWRWVKYRPLHKPRDKVRARLKEGYSVEQCKLVLDYLAAKWGGNAEMRQYYNLVTPFRPANFERYLAEAEDWDARGRPPLQKAARDAAHGSYEELKKQKRALGGEYRSLVTEYRLLQESRYLTPQEEHRKQELAQRLRELKKEIDSLEDHLSGG